jgi:aldehyde:ferredoxin oxidoreductase
MFRGGWTGKILWIDLTNKKARTWEYDPNMAKEYIGGRGFAIRILWDYLKPGTDPLHPNNLLIFAVGPITGHPLPSSGKLVVASKSPLTGGYGDGNIGTKASVMMKKAGYDAIVIEGRAEKPTYVYIEDQKTEFHNAGDYWGVDAKELHDMMTEEYGRDAGVLTIGKAGENMIYYAVIMSEKDRAGGRPGMGAVMGSKRLKALVIRGSEAIKAVDMDRLRKMGVDAYKDVKKSPMYSHWMEQGTMGVYEWCQENSVLPTHNFREGVFEDADKMTGKVMAEKYKTHQKGCPNCNMLCGNVAETKEDGGVQAEMDYENVAMFSSNIGISNMNHVIRLIRYADDLGVDTITMGSVISYTIEAYEKGYLKPEELDGLKPEWGDYETAKEIIDMVISKNGFGRHLARGIKYASMRLGGDTLKFAMQVKGMPVSAYDCHVAPGMALSFGTSPIGAHHKDAWVIAWEAQYGFDKIDERKVRRVIELQRIRGGWFEVFVTCRLPWVEVGLSLDYYPKFMEAVTGIKYTTDDLDRIADKIYNLMRAFWIREYGYWKREMDIPPARWFEEPLTKGPRKGAHIDIDAYNKMLDIYYDIRGWDRSGIPRKSTMKRFGLTKEMKELESLGIVLEP